MTEEGSGQGLAIAPPGQPLQVYGSGGSKRSRSPTHDTPSKRRKHEPCKRPRTSGEDLWGPSYTKSLYCSDTDKGRFGIRFEWRRNKTSASDAAAPLFQPAQLSIVEGLKFYGDASLKAIIALLAPYGLQPRKQGQGRMLRLRWRGSASVVATDGVFHASSTGSMIAYVNFTDMGRRRERHPMALLPEARREKKENRERRAKEQHRIRPETEEEDAQIALIMAAMAQEMLSGEPNQSGVWARVIGINMDKIFLYRGWVSRRFVETFDARKGFVVQYGSIMLKYKARVLQQLDRLLREKRPPRDQPGAAEETKC